MTYIIVSCCISFAVAAELISWTINRVTFHGNGTRKDGEL